MDSHQLQDTFHMDLHHANMTREDFMAIAPALIQQSTQGCQYIHPHESEGPTDAESE